MSPGSPHSCRNAYTYTRDEVPFNRNKWPEKERLRTPLSGMLKLLRELQSSVFFTAMSTVSRNGCN